MTLNLQRERIMFITHLKPLQPKTAITDDLVNLHRGRDNLLYYTLKRTNKSHCCAHAIYTYIHMHMAIQAESPQPQGPVQGTLPKVSLQTEIERISFITHLKLLQPKTAITDDLVW
jgi:hypothetical protein